MRKVLRRVRDGAPRAACFCGFRRLYKPQQLFGNYHEEKKSDAGTKVGFLGLTATFLGDGGVAIAEFSLAPERVQKLAKLLRQTREAFTASVARVRKFAGKLPVA